MGVFTMPSLGADMETGTLVEWLVKPGDTVHRGDVVAVVETQKGAIEIEIFEEGTVHDLLGELDKELPVGTPLATILGEGEAPPASAPEQTPVTEDENPATPELGSAVKPPEPTIAAPQMSPNSASPAARVRAHELGLDLAAVTGSGPGGVIVYADVENAAANSQPKSPKTRSTGSQFDEMRKAIAAAMTRSKQTIPHFYLSETIDVLPAIEFLERLNADRAPGDRVLLGALFVRAAALSASKVKVTNGRYTDDVFQPSDVVNPGIAVALRGGGLVAPAIHDAVSLTVDETMSAMRDLVTRARAGRLKSSEMTMGTITISSLGDTGAETMTGVIFPPQVALVGIGAPHVRPWIVEGRVVPRSVVTLSISADHRVSDGRQIAKYIAEFEALMKDPEAL